MNGKIEIYERTNADAAKKIAGEEFLVLDGGFVALVDYMGDDSEIARTARVSRNRVKGNDVGTLRDLVRWGHWTPFESARVKLAVRAPFFVWKQWIRHRTASVCERSGRYSEVPESAMRTGVDEWRRADGTLFESDFGELLTDDEDCALRDAFEVYKARVRDGIALEQARKDLPLSTYTSAYWTIDLHNLFHFLKLRLAPSAQKEIRDYARTIAEKIVAPLFPISYEAFLDYDLNAIKLSVYEQRMLAGALSKNAVVKRIDEVSEREFAEFAAKFKRLLERKRSR